MCMEKQQLSPHWFGSQIFFSTRQAFAITTFCGAALLFRLDVPTPPPPAPPPPPTDYWLACVVCTIYVRTDHFNCEYHRPLVITQPRSGEEQKQNQQPATNKDYIVQIHINTTKTDSRRAQRRRSPWHHHPHLIPSHLGHCQPTSQPASYKPRQHTTEDGRSWCSLDVFSN